MTAQIPDLLDIRTHTRAPQPVLTSADGLVLRPWLMADAPVVFAAFRDPDIQRWEVRTMTSDSEARQLVERWRQAWSIGAGAHWAVTEDDRVVGRVTLKNFSAPNALGELAYWAVPDVRGRGITAGAVRIVTAWAFDDIGFHRIELLHSVHNAASCRVAVKAGFSLEGTKRSAFNHVDGWHDMHIHARINGD
ncbi:GNAT family N-acetyltransferase [Nocardia sp. NPDC052566]|uniref:GNAT family N-acetyltransferase n=1 Tax=Nocardia sp. NPDC052566 TaxID=3364330 RepID=UPI0037C92438